jgi:hypothetical protein
MATTASSNVGTLPNCYPEYNPIDTYRAHICSQLAHVTGVDEQIIYPAIQWTQTLDKGDLTLAVPALRVKGKPADLATEWAEKVSQGAIPQQLLNSIVIRVGLDRETNSKWAILTVQL